MDFERRDFLKLSGALTYTIAAGGCATGAQTGAPAKAAGGKVEVHWLGQAATRLTSTTGKVIVIDPFITNNPKTPPVMIPIGGHFVMDPRDAVFVTNTMLRPKFAIPFHYGTFPVLKGTPQEYQKHLGSTSTQVFPISPGDKLAF
jgi:L-ascorbate metabolism protein UlaG (beta-lactamase superfamily)